MSIASKRATATDVHAISRPAADPCSFLKRLLRRLNVVKHQRRPAPLPDLYAAGAARWLVTHLLSRQAAWRHVVEDSRLAATITDRRLARVIEFMSAHLDRPLSLGELAREAGISVHHLGRRFRERTGMGPAGYLATLRIEQARLLLATTDLAVAEIGVLCGYPCASAFSTAFLRHVGATPGAWRSAR